MNLKFKPKKPTQSKINTPKKPTQSKINPSEVLRNGKNYIHILHRVEIVVHSARGANAMGRGESIYKHIA